MLRRVILFVLSVFFIYNCNHFQAQPAHRLTLKNWQLKAADSVQASGQRVAQTDFKTQNWLTARVPNTVMGALLKAGRYQDIFVGMNLKKVSTKPFQNGWWYRCSFDLPDLKRLPKNILRFNGLNYRADVFLNGRQIASKDSLFGAFRVFEMDISSLVKEKNNTLAVCVYPPQAGNFTIGFVDWNPAPPDRNMGLWRPVEIRRAKNVLLKNPFVKTAFDSSLQTARLTVQVTACNLSDKPVSGVLKGTIESHSFKKAFHLKAGESATITVDAEEFPQLVFKRPRLWWPVHWGKANLYDLELLAKIEGQVSDALQIRFGMRKIESYFTDEGHRAFKINGRKILIQGAGWTDDLFLAQSAQNVRSQLRYVKEMGLNTIRLEGFWGNGQTLYDLCDSLGILIMAGFSCQWEWEDYLGKACDQFGGARSEQDMDLLSAYWRDQITFLRNHPSIFVWMAASDMLPRPALEKRYLRILEQIDGTRPYLASAAARVSQVSGPTGVKMNGPYDYVPPRYWFEDRKYGGAFGFNTETGPGPQPPPLSSLQKMIPAQHLWPIDSVWDYHCGRNEFNSLKRYQHALNQRYGQPDNVNDFVRIAQAMNYEAMRAMFEAFAVNKFQATGIIQWMLNSAWPELYWQLYDYYLMPNGAFYGAKKACDSLQLMYDYSNQTVFLNNNTLKAFSGLVAHIKLFDLQSNLVDERQVQTAIAPNAVKTVTRIPEDEAPTPVYFLDLRLFDARGRRLAANFYWLSRKRDVLDYEKTTWFVTPIKQFADFTALNALPAATVKVKTIPAGDNGKLTVRLQNTSEHLAFMLYLELQTERGQTITPVFWSDNYLSLLPGEQRELTVRFAGNENAVIKVNGWNTDLRYEN